LEGNLSIEVDNNICGACMAYKSSKRTNNDPTFHLNRSLNAHYYC